MDLMNMEELKVTLQLSNIKYDKAMVSSNIIIFINEEIKTFIECMLNKHQFKYFYNPFGNIYVYNKENEILYEQNRGINDNG